jgi:hypothetical protein
MNAHALNEYASDCAHEDSHGRIMQRDTGHRTMPSVHSWARMRRFPKLTCLIHTVKIGPKSCKLKRNLLG